MIQYSNVRYLQSKQPIDDRALNRQVLGALERLLRSRTATPRVLELGAGVGTMVSRLADWNVLRRAEYTLVDRESESLAAARRHLERWGTVTQSSADAIAVEKGDARLDVEFVCSDVFEFLDQASRGERYDLVFANAVLDLTDLEPTLPCIWRALAPGAAYWFTINFDGETIFLPEHPLDSQVVSLYHGTMTADAAGTRAGHPETGRRLLLAIPQSGASLLSAGSSDWVVFPIRGTYPGDEAYFLHHILDTVRGALEGRADIDAAALQEGLRSRHAQVERGELVFIAHQLDVFGLARGSGRERRRDPVVSREALSGSRTPEPSRSVLGRALASSRGAALLALAYLATRVALCAAGLRFNLDLHWMFLADVEALHHHLLRTVLYFHAFAPGMNLITGALLALSPGHMAALATGLFWLFGATMTVSLGRVLTLLGSSRPAAAVLALAFSLLPQTLFLENLYLYTYLCACLLVLGAVLFHRALLRATPRAWLAFFLLCAVLGWLYTVFHLVWFALMAGIAAVAQARASRAGWGRALGAVALGAAFPALLMLGLYAKNYALFGVFGATSWGASNMTLATTQQMRPAERNRWIREGKLSRYAAINVYAPPSAYVGLVPPRVYPWPDSNELVRPTLGDPNYNHGLFLEVNEARRKDVAYFLDTRPMDYLRRVVSKNLPSLFHSSTHWHPHDGRPDSPHRQHREVLGGYEAAYDTLVHSWPVPRVGLYVFLPAFLVWAAWSTWKRLRARDSDTFAAGALLGFCLLQILFVVSTSSLFTSWETSRYRYAIEPCIWVVVASALRSAYARARDAISALRAPARSG